MYARRVLLKERFHYANNATFSNTDGKALKSSALTWTVTNNGSGRPYVTSPAAGTTRNLMNTRKHPLSTVMMFEFHVKPTAWTGAINSTNGIGMLFMADAPAGSTTEEYRLRQGSDKLMLEKASPGWATNASWALNTTLNADCYYRVFYARSALTLYNWPTPFTAGKFFIYRGTTQENMTYIGTATDASPLTNGTYIGLFKGSGSTIQSSHMGVYRLWELDTQSVEWTHEVDQDSTAVIELSRDPDALITSDTISNRWEVWAPQFNGSTSTENLYLVFDGSLERTAEGPARIINLEGWTREMKDLQWVDQTPSNATTLSYLRGQLATGGGQMSIGASPSSTSTYVLHSNGLDATGITESSNREIAGKSMDMPFRQLVHESGSFYFFHPEGMFWVRKSLVTGPAVIDTASQYLPLIGYEIWKDGRQIVNSADGYYTGYTTPTSSTNSTSIGLYGVRSRAVVDMMTIAKTPMDNSIKSIVDDKCRNDYIFKLDLGQSHFNYLPGMAVTVKLAGTLFGTNNGDADTDNWVAEKCTLFKTHYSSNTSIHSLYLSYNGTLGDATLAICPSFPRDTGSKSNMAQTLKHLLSMDV